MSLGLARNCVTAITSYRRSMRQAVNDIVMSSDADFSLQPPSHLNSHLNSHFYFFVYKPAVCHSPCFLSFFLFFPSSPADCLLLSLRLMRRRTQSHRFLVLNYQSLWSSLLCPFHVWTNIIVCRRTRQRGSSWEMNWVCWSLGEHLSLLCSLASSPWGNGEATSRITTRGLGRFVHKMRSVTFVPAVLMFLCGLHSECVALLHP